MVQVWSDEISLSEVGGELMIGIPDGLVSISTTERGESLFNGKGVTFYKSGFFVVKIPADNFRLIAKTLNDMMSNIDREG